MLVLGAILKPAMVGAEFCKTTLVLEVPTPFELSTADTWHSISSVTLAVRVVTSNEPELVVLLVGVWVVLVVRLTKLNVKVGTSPSRSLAVASQRSVSYTVGKAGVRLIESTTGLVLSIVTEADAVSVPP